MLKSVRLGIRRTSSKVILNNLHFTNLWKDVEDYIFLLCLCVFVCVCMYIYDVCVCVCVCVPVRL